MGQERDSEDQGFVDLDAFPDVDPDTALDPIARALIDTHLASSPSPTLSPGRWADLIGAATTGDVDEEIGALAAEAMHGFRPFDVDDDAGPFEAGGVDVDDPFPAGGAARDAPFAEGAVGHDDFADLTELDETGWDIDADRGYEPLFPDESHLQGEDVSHRAGDEGPDGWIEGASVDDDPVVDDDSGGASDFGDHDE